jgi:hypothetical protein
VSGTWREQELAYTQHRLQLVLVRLLAGSGVPRARGEAQFYAGRCRQAYWRGVRPGPGWRMPAEVTMKGRP